MADFFKKLGQKVVDFFKNMKKGQRIRLIILAAVIIIIISAVSVVLNQKNYTVLYSGMDAKDAGEVLSVLTDMKVDAKAQGTDTIVVASDQVDKIRMELAAQGYPSSGYNYDIFKNASGLGTTDMEKNFYLQMQLQENIRQTIKKMDKVSDARVNITLPDDSQFVLSNEKKTASAAVMLTLKPGKTIDNDDVRAIAELVSKSVSGLSLDDVRIIDSKMKLYKIEDESETDNVGTQLELQNAVQDNLQKQVINLLTPVFGENKILAQVNAKLNFDKQTSQTEVFTPPVEGDKNGIAVSMKQLAETIKNYNGTGGTPGVSSNGGTTQYPATVTGNSDAVYSQVSNEANYEINETKTQVEKAKGRIEELSVSVILDSSNSQEDYSDNVRKLVANAIGVSDDHITVETLPFKKLESADSSDAVKVQKQLMNEVQNAQTTRLVIIAAAVLIVMLILLSIVKSFRKSRQPVLEGPNIPAEYGGVEYLADEEYVPDASPPVEVNFDAKEDNNITQLEKYIDKSPESVAQLLRNWLSEDNGR